MKELKEIKQQIDNVRNEYNDYSVYNFEIKQKQAELDGLKDEEDGSTKKSKILKLQREIDSLEILETDNVREAYSDLVGSFNELSTPLYSYITQRLDNDKEVQRLKQEYHETQQKLMQLAVDHNLRLQKKLDQLKEEIAGTDYYKLGREISDNRMVQVLGYRTPNTNYIKFYKTDDKEIRVPKELEHRYEEALREHDIKRKPKEDKQNFFKGLLTKKEG